MKAIYVEREDGDYDFIAAFDLEKVELLTDCDADEYFRDLVLALDTEPVKVHEEESISDFPDVLSGADVAEPKVLHSTAYEQLLCVPEHWTDSQITEFAGRATSDKTADWVLRTAGNTLPGTYDTRVACSSCPRRSQGAYVHVYVDR